MMTKLALLGLALVAATASSATANVVAYDGYAPRPASRPETRDASERRVEGRFGMLLGGSDVGDADGFSLGFSGALGYRLGDVTLRAIFDYYRVGDGGDEAMSRRGRAARIGGAVRYAMVSAGFDEPDSSSTGIDLWTEVGAGLEHVSWREGGVLDRPSLELALGFDVDRRGKPRSDGSRRYGGYFMAFRTHLANGPEMDTPAVCGGPCSRATKPSRLDASMFFDFGFHFGR